MTEMRTPDARPIAGPAAGPAGAATQTAEPSPPPAAADPGGRSVGVVQASGAEQTAIVPLGGLPVVAVVLVGLVATIATNRLWAIDFFHVVGGGLWTALDLFLGFVLGPILGRLSVPARVEVTRRLMPKMLLIMPTLVICTLAAGWQLARRLGTLSTSYPDHAWVVASMVVVAVMAVVALGVLEPANLTVLFELRRPDPDGRVVARLMRRFLFTAGVTGAMQVATLIIMTRLATA